MDHVREIVSRTIEEYIRRDVPQAPGFLIFYRAIFRACLLRWQAGGWKDGISEEAFREVILESPYLPYLNGGGSESARINAWHLAQAEIYECEDPLAVALKKIRKSPTRESASDGASSTLPEPK